MANDTYLSLANVFFGQKLTLFAKVNNPWAFLGEWRRIEPSLASNSSVIMEFSKLALGQVNACVSAN
ncbi:MAG: hypothetical protein ACRECY_01135 [Phyllobacterium sp.]